MAANVANVRASDAMHQVTIRVTGLRGLAWRVWVASKLFHLAGWVLACCVAIETDDR